jgi:hypothetical protein
MKIRKRTINVSEKALASNNDLFFHFIFYYSTKKRKKDIERKEAIIFSFVFPNLSK